MQAQVILLKVKQRLNKLASNDYDNIETWQIIEAFNKAQVDWCRRNLHGLNVVKEGDEQSTRRIDDLQVLLHTAPLPGTNRKDYFESHVLYSDYLQWKRIICQATSACCPKPRKMKIFLAEEGNVDMLLSDVNKQPSLEWGETFATVKGGKVYIYTKDFDIVKSEIVYYRQPSHIAFAGMVDPYTGQTSTVDINPEFKDDLVELFIDETAKILSGDIESMIQTQRESQSVESNN